MYQSANYAANILVFVFDKLNYQTQNYHLKINGFFINYLLTILYWIIYSVKANLSKDLGFMFSGWNSIWIKHFDMQ